MTDEREDLAKARRAIFDAAENYVIAVGMGWDLDGVTTVLRQALSTLSGDAKGSITATSDSLHVVATPAQPKGEWAVPVDLILQELQKVIDYGDQPTCNGVTTITTNKLKAARDIIKQLAAAPSPALAAVPTREEIDSLRSLLQEVAEEFGGTIAQYHKIGPDWTFKDGTEGFEASTILDREPLIERIRTALFNPLPAQPAWQPIETAPRDGTEVLIAGRYPNGAPYVESGFWLSDHWRQRRLDPPTHWMPLPAPPAQPEDMGERG